MADYNSSYTGAEIDEGVGNGLAAPTTYAPIDHAASASTYGAGTGTKYGHLMLSDSTSSTSSTNGGVAATPAAVKAAYDLADGKQDPITLDNAPTQDSANPVKSGGVYAALGSKADQSALNTFVRPNLLVNGYFVGGGSQQGGGQFPINTRGQTSYTGGNIYGIDRWKSTGSNPVIAVESGCLSFTPSGTYSTVRQYIEDFKSLSGKTVTISAIVEADAAFDFIMILQYHDASNVEQNPIFFIETVSNKRLVTATGTMPDLSSAKDCYLRIGNGSTVPNIPLKIYAAKVELGSTQTLAHQENGVWVLNEVPDYNEQMLRCNEGLGQFAQVEYGSYTGTGTYGSTNANSLTFAFVPKFLLVKQEASSAYSIVAANGLTSVYSDYSTSYSNTMTWSDKTVTWYSTNAARQLNTASTVYHYVAFG